MISHNIEMPDSLKEASDAMEAERGQVGGDHYSKRKIQPFDVIDDWGMDFYEGNALKYLARHRDKNGKEDLQKAIHYINEVIKRQYLEMTNIPVTSEPPGTTNVRMPEYKECEE